MGRGWWGCGGVSWWVGVGEVVVMGLSRFGEWGGVG